MSQIIVYVDEGVGGCCLGHLVRALRKSVDLTRHSLKRMDAEALRKEKWEDQTALFIMPGGRDVFFHEKLKGEGVRRIGEYIHAGGNYLGICAGAYFGAAEIEFEKGGQLEVCARRSLSFFPGRAVGPAYGLNRYRIDSDRGAEAALINWKDEFHSFAFFNGGCFFETPEKYSDVTVLGRYVELDNHPAALISCAVGKGKALLSGVHFEYSLTHLLNDSPYLDHIVRKMKKTETQGVRFLYEVLEHLGLTLIRDK